MLLALWKFFHYRHLTVNFLENTSKIYGEPSIVPVCPCVTRWTTHDRTCKNLYNGYKQFLSALAVCLNERQEPEALGLFTEIKGEEFTATILMLRNIFDAVQPLNLALQKSDGLPCLYVPMYLNKTLLALEKLPDENKRVWFNRKKFLEMQTTAEEQMLSLPPSANLRNSVKFSFEKFCDETYPCFITRFVEEIKETFTQLDFWLAFSIFDPRKLPENLEAEGSYGEEEIHKLISWYGVQKSDTYEDKTTSKKEDLEAEKFRAEWPGFLHLKHERCIMDQKKHRH